MASNFALSLSKWTLDALTRVIKADVRIHHAERLETDMSAIFAVNHFTRLETVLLPYFLHKLTQQEVWALAAAELFESPIGDYLSKVGAISTKDPDRDKTIVHSLLKGDHPWLIFPEGAMIKDKKVVDANGEFQIYSRGERRAPHTGAAVLALRAEFYRHKISCLKDRPDSEDLQRAMEWFAIDDVESVLGGRTAIVPDPREGQRDHASGEPA